MEGDITVNGVRLHYRIDGPEDGVPLVLSNSLATDLSMWDGQIPALTDKYRVLRYDKRGHGQSEPKDESIEIKTLADDAVALADALGFTGGHFCGLSIGGMTGQAVGLYHPDAFKSLALCATASAIPEQLHPIWEDRIATVGRDGMEPMVAPTLERWFTEGYRARAQDKIGAVGDMIRGTSPTGYIRCSEAIMRLNYTDRLGSITTPTIVIPGEVDPALTLAMSETIHEAIPGSELQPVKGAAHLCNIEDPEQFNGILRGWLDRN